MLGLLCSCTVTALPGLLSVGPRQGVAWLPVWWHARDRHCLGTDPLGEGGGGGGGIGGDTAAVLPGLKLGIPVLFFVLLLTMYMSGSYHLISQAGWNR